MAVTEVSKLSVTAQPAQPSLDTFLGFDQVLLEIDDPRLAGEL